jgi:hypothetical protein
VRAIVLKRVKICIFSKFWGKTKTLTQRREAAKIIKEKDALFPDFASKFSFLCASALKRQKPTPNY